MCFSHNSVEYVVHSTVLTAAAASATPNPCGCDPCRRPCQATAHDGEAERVLLEDVQECVAEMVEIVQSYKNRNMVSRAFMSPLCKQRLEEAGVAIMSAVQRLQVGRVATRQNPAFWSSHLLYLHYLSSSQF